MHFKEKIMKGINKRLLLIILAVVLVLAVGLYFLIRPEKADSASGVSYNTNLLENGDFSQLDEDGMPVSWYTDYYIDHSWENQPEPIFEVSEDGVSIENPEGLDARFAQRVSVEPNALYCLTGKIRADAQGGRGANVSVDGVYAFSQSVYKTGEEWQEVSLYGRTGEEQDSIIVYVRLGGYSGESTGKAWFTDISLTRIAEAPDGVDVEEFFIPQYYQNDNSPSSAVPTEEKGTASTLILLVSLLFVLFFLSIKDRFTGVSPLVQMNNLSWLWLSLILLLAFAARVLAAVRVPGYDVDIGCFTSWAQTIAQHGPAGFYNSAGFCDYPPGYMYILWIVGLIGQVAGGITELMLKMPSIISDVMICLVLYLEGKKHMQHRNALLLSLFWALNPVSFVAGACWGQTDSLMTLLLLLSVIMLFKKQWKIALPLYVLAVLVKPQALMFGPMGAAMLVLHLKKSKCSKQSIVDLLIGIGVSVSVFCVVALPFVLNISPYTYLSTKGFEHEEIQAKLAALSNNPALREMEGYALGGGVFNKLSNGLKFIFSLYGNTMGHYDRVTINGCNFYFLLDLNWVPLTETVSLFVALLALLLCSLPAVLGTAFSGKNTKERIPFFFSCGLLLLGAAVVCILHNQNVITYGAFGTIMIAYICMLCIGLFLLRGDKTRLPVYAAAMLMLLFNFGTMMHERYLLPVIILLLLGFLTTRDKRLLYLMVLTTVASFINITCVLDRNIRIGGSSAHLNMPYFYVQSDLYILEYLSAGLTTLAAMLCLYLAASPTRAYALPAENPLPSEKVKKSDVVIILIATALYATLAFVNLGSTVSPQTAWISTNYRTETYTLLDTPESQFILEHTELDDPIRQSDRTVYEPETLTLDLGEEKEFTIQYFGGIHLYFDGHFTLVVESESGIQDQHYCTILQGQCFQWQNVPGTFKGRYIHLTADNDKLMLFEILFRDAKTGAILPASLAASSNGNPTAASVCDEPYSMAGTVPSWYNSTYFDEIYHARTAYEHLHGMQPYETSHPPLGKVLMSWAIAVFGMTPFGWRFAGTLAGVMMLPGMYLLAKLLCRNKWAGLFAMLMMAFDTMHFTQTRIATIDSFVVLFIIWSVYFMLRWFRMEDFFAKPFWKTLVPLFLSGIFMGLSIASKWTGVYNIIALAVIFFWGFFRRLQEWLSARKDVKQYHQELESYNLRKLNTHKKASKKGESTNPPPVAPAPSEAIYHKGYVLPATIGLCILFFIVIPLLIYYLSYIPYFAYDGGVTVEKVIRAAVGNYFETGELTVFDGMLGYHSQEGLGMDHRFYSPWYEWPVIAKPMYYYWHPYNTQQSSQTIVLMGNPAVWWSCLVGLLALIGTAIYRHMRYDVYKYENPGAMLGYEHFHVTQPWDFRYGLLIVCFLAQYLPWVLVPRGTYIYHYFTSVPFIILATSVCLDKLSERWNKIALVLGAAILLAALSCFIAFFPYASGAAVSQNWLKTMQWFDNWLFY